MISSYCVRPVSDRLYGEPTVESSCSTTDLSNTVPSTGSTQANRIVSALSDARFNFLPLPPEIKRMVCDQLSYRDVAALSQTCKMLYTLIDEQMLVYRACFKHHLTPAHQENFRATANLLTQQQFETYIRQFSNDQQFITHCLSLLGNKSFPEFLFFHTMRLKTKCQNLEVKAIKDIEHKNAILVNGTFSPNGRHILTTNGLSGMVHSLNDKDQWEINTFVPRRGWLLLGASFSPNSQYLVIACRPDFLGDDWSDQDEIEIYTCSNVGEWARTTTIPYDCNIEYLPVIFFNKSQNITLISGNDEERLTIYGLDSNENWSSDSVSSQLFHVQKISHSPNGLHGATLRCQSNINGMDFPFIIDFFAVSGHNWLPQCHFPCGKVYDLNFSPDSQHLIVVHHRELTIYGINSNGNWEPKETINNQDNDDDINDDNFVSYNYRPIFHHNTFSPNGCYLVAVTRYSYRVQIYHLNSGNQWHQIKTINHNCYVNTASFSPDSQHLMTVNKNYSVRIYDLDTDEHNSLTEAIINDSAVQHADFSPDSSHLVTICANDQIKIYGMLANRKWVEKGSVSKKTSDNPNTIGFQSVKFSPCGFLILAGGAYGAATIYTLRST